MTNYKFKSLYKTNRKEYYRRAKISKAVTQYWQTRKRNERIITEQFKKPVQEKAKKIVQEKILQKRLRKQVVYNSDYHISIRVIQYNGSATLKEMEGAMDEFLNNNPELQTIPFDTEGLEQENVSVTEDKSLSDGIIYLELNIRGNVTFINL
jgi:transketolase